jgi:iron complex outermembrane receptor protein
MQKTTTTTFAIAVLLAFACTPLAQAQTGQIAGVVTDSSTGGPLPGVNVVLVDEQQGTTTDPDGQYEISGLSPGAYDLQASFVGYSDRVVEDVQVSAGETTEVNFSLAPEVTQLQEVVAVGYGTQQRQDLTGSVASTNVEEAEVAGVNTSPQELLQGAAAGVNITQSNGEPGARTSVRVRGFTSINASNSPLFVIDGTPLQEYGAPGGFGVGRNPLSFINPGSIESIDVLKDASATAIYGARGSNGVVLIQTKDGKAGDVQVNYSSSVSTSNMHRKLDLLSGGEYRNFVEDQVEAGNLPERQLERLGDASTDWQEAITRRAVSQKHNLALSGGTESTRYRASVNYANEEGTVIGSGTERFRGRFKANLQALDDRLQLNANFTSAYVEDDYYPYEEQGRSFMGQAGFTGALRFNPTFPVRNSDGNFLEYAPRTPNPVAVAHQVTDRSETLRTIADLSADVDITEGLSASVDVGGELSRSTRDTYFAKESPLVEGLGGRAERVQNELTSKRIEATTNYNNTFGAHNLDAVVGFSYQDWFNQGFGADAENFITDLWTFNNLGAGGRESLTPSSFKGMHKLASIFGRLNYDYESRYLLSLSLRRDGSSRFGENRRWGLFPAASAAWRLSQDLSLPDAITDLKLRVGYGVTGNQDIGNYAALETLAPGFRAVFGQQTQVGVAPNQFANPELQWEEKSTLNFGVDFALLSGRLSGSAEYYRSTTDKLLANLPVPQPAVVGTQLDNVGEMENTGVEFSLDGTVVDQEDVSLSIGVTASRNNNEILSLGGGRDRILYGRISGPGSGGASSILQPGDPVGTFYGPVFAGFENQDQIFKDYEDTDGDGIGDEVVGTTASPSSEDRQVIGSAEPDLIYGFSTQATWEGWSLSASFDGKYGQEIFNNTALAHGAKTLVKTSNNFLVSALDDPTDLNESAIYSSRWIQDGSYLRLSRLTLGYTLTGLPQVRRARIYIQGSNLFVITPYDGYDPEVSTDNAGGLPARGVDYLNYPRPRTFTLGVSINM